MQDLNIALIQANLFWEDPERNLEQFDRSLEKIGQTADVVVLPEMFSTGFTMDTGRNAEPMDGPVLKWMQQKSKTYQCILAGSILIREKKKFFNRFVWMKSDGSFQTYDKRHRFTMAGENAVMEAGNSPTIVQHQGWNLNLQVCYDLRFPVWSRNSYDKGKYSYDVLVYVANWPEIRKEAYQRLLPARAIENMAYVLWVNRIGKDGNGKTHSGDTAVYSPAGEILVSAGSGVEQSVLFSLPVEALKNYREQYNFGPDWDRFKILD